MVIKVIFSLMLPLVLLGFLSSTTMNMYGNMEQLKDENQKLSHELSQLRSNYQAVAQERDALRAEHENLKYQFNSIQTAYLTENQARLKAESDAATYKDMVFNLANHVQTGFPAACVPEEQQAIQPKPGEILLSNIAPLGAGSLIMLVVIGIMTRHYRMRRR